MVVLCQAANASASHVDSQVTTVHYSSSMGTVPLHCCAIHIHALPTKAVAKDSKRRQPPTSQSKEYKALLHQYNAVRDAGNNHSAW